MGQEKLNGIIPNVIVKEFETDPELIELIVKKRKLPKQQVEDMLRHNVLTVRQVADLSGKTIGYINNISNGYYRGIFELNACFPFPQSVGPQKMIYRNSKCELWLKKINENGSKNRTSKSKKGAATSK